MKRSILPTIFAALLLVVVVSSACSGDEECEFCGEWVLISSAGEELIEYNNIMTLAEDGTFEFQDSIRTTSGKWATFNQSEKIIFQHEDWLKPLRWTGIRLSGDTMFVKANEEFDLILVRKTEENTAVLNAGLTRIDHFDCAPRYTAAIILYEDNAGRKKQLELTTYCANDEFITLKDPLKKNKGVNRHFYHYSNTAAVITFISSAGDKEYKVDRNSFLDSLQDESTRELLLQSIFYNDYRTYEGLPSFLATFTDTTGAIKKNMYFFVDEEEGQIELYGPHPPPPYLELFPFEIPELIDQMGTGDGD
jgi:hypothetical protein